MPMERERHRRPGTHLRAQKYSSKNDWPVEIIHIRGREERAMGRLKEVRQPLPRAFSPAAEAHKKETRTIKKRPTTRHRKQIAQRPSDKHT